MSHDDHPNEITQYRLKAIEETLASIGETLKQLTTLEQKHLETRKALERAFDAIGKHEERMRAIELELPTMKLIRGWVITGVIGCTALLGATLLKLVIQN